MKLVGITGTGTGKLGSSVFAVNSGVQIVRQYQPVVANPSTPAQVEQRAKLKLASQLARDLKGSIAIAKDGIVTARNRFMSENFDLISYANNKAEADLPNVQLTKGTAFMPAIESIKAQPVRESFEVTFADELPEYEYYSIHVYKRNADGTLSLRTKKDLEAAFVLGEGKVKSFSVVGITPALNDVVFIYGYDYASSDARIKYSNMVVNQGGTIASLIASRSEVANSVSFSRTAGGTATTAED